MYLQGRSGDADTETRLVVASGEELGRVDWESGVSGCRLAHRDGKARSHCGAREAASFPLFQFKLFI